MWTSVTNYYKPKRRAISSQFPILVRPAVFTKRTARLLKNKLTLKKLHKGEYLRSVVARHSSLLYRKLGDSDTELQINKVTNLKIAIAILDGIMIPSGAIFSFWDNIGSITTKKGYVDGMLLSNGQVAVGLGGGLCQLSNFLMWIFLHTDCEIIERYHHSVDAFPDSGRTLPFGSGATIFSNFVDLKIKNSSPYPLQLKLWLTDTALKGQILSTQPAEKKYHIVEKNHQFIQKDDDFFRYNEIYRETLTTGTKIDEQLIFSNFAPVVYKVDTIQLKERNIVITNLNEPA